MILFLLIFNLIIRPSISAHFCQTKDKSIDNILTIGDYVLIGSNDRNYWIYDLTKDEFLDNRLSVESLFSDDFESVLYVSSIEKLASNVVNTEANRKSLNLVIAIGLTNNSKTLGFKTYRFNQNPISLYKIQNLNELPNDWGLHTEGKFTKGLNLGMFWPKNLFKYKTNSELIDSQVIKSFNYLSSKHIFLMKSDAEDTNQYSVKYIESDGHLTDWQTIDMQMNSEQRTDNCLKLFKVNESLFMFCQKENQTIIEFQIFLNEKNSVLHLATKRVNANIEEFFGCDKPEPRGLFDRWKKKTSPGTNKNLDSNTSSSITDYDNDTEQSTDEEFLTQELTTENLTTTSDNLTTTSDKLTATSEIFDMNATNEEIASNEEEVDNKTTIGFFHVLFYLLLIYLTALLVTYVVHLILYWDIADNKQLTKIYYQYYRAEIVLENNIMPKTLKLKKIKMKNN